jgi:adenylate cyclase
LNFDILKGDLYMTNEELELELAWLVKFLPENLTKLKSIEIKQGYIESSDPKVKDVRIREKEGKFTYTTKTFIKNSQETGYNKESTRQLSKEEFSKLWGKANKKVRKLRYFYPMSENLTAEVDVYQDNLDGLVVVEVEFPSVSAYKAFEVPDWFGKEVTDSKGVYPPVIADMTIEEVKKINEKYRQKPHEFE